jgi:drug/metabolite transporter (DMT)-like permease
MIYLLLSIAISSGLFVIFKLFDSFKINTLQAIVVNYLVAAILGFSLSELPVSVNGIVEQSWFIGAVLLGFLFIAVFNLMALTSQQNGLSVASVAGKMSLVVGVIFGILYYKESANTVKIVGILLALLAVYLASVKPTKNLKTNKKSSLLFPVLLFFGSGCIDTSLKFIETTYVQSAGVPIFSATIFAIAFVLGMLFLSVQFLKGKFTFQIKNIIGGIVLGIPNYFSIVYLLKALSAEGMESSTAFTVNNVGIVILSTLLGLFLFKERLSAKNWLGVLVAVVSVYLVFRHG